MHAKLGLLYRRTAEQLTTKADGYAEMRIEIAKKVVELDDARQELAVKLEYISVKLVQRMPLELVLLMM